MKKWLPAIGLIAVALAVSWYFRNAPIPAPDRPEGDPGPAAPKAGAPSALPAAPAKTPPPATASGGSPAPQAIPAVIVAVPSTTDEPLPMLSPAAVVDNMRNVIHQYGSRFGGNPVGTNPEITRALNGENPKQVKFITPESGLRVNEKGELLDPWGTPFFFHQISGKEMEIRSAGPDKIMWNLDDIVTR